MVVVKDAVDLADLGGGGVGGMDRVDGAIDGRKEGNIAGDKEIGGRSEGEGKMAMDAVAGIGWDSGGVGVELGLGETDGGVGGRGSDGGNGGKDWVRKGGSDGGGGEGRHFLHSSKEKYINFY